MTRVRSPYLTRSCGFCHRPSQCGVCNGVVVQIAAWDPEQTLSNYMMRVVRRMSRIICVLMCVPT